MNDIIETTGREVTDVQGAEMLAREINAIKKQTMRTVLLASIEIGEKLTQAKALVAYGEWENWLAENVDYSQSTANNLMKIYREYGDEQYDLFSDKPKSEIFGELTYSQAVSLFALPAHERQEFVESHDMSAMSTRDVDEEIKKLRAEKEAAEKKTELLEASLVKASEAQKDTAAAEEDLRKLEEELEDARSELSDATERAEEAEKALAELKAIAEKASAPEQVTIDDVPTEEIDKLKADLSAKLEAEYTEKAKLEADKAKEKQAAAKEKEKRSNERIASLEAEVARLEQQSRRNEGAAAVQQFAALFESFQEDFNRMLSKLSALEASDSETGAKIRAALGKVVGSMVDKVKGET